MTNVFTRKHRLPRSVTLLDYPNQDLRKQSTARPRSPTRIGNPHPLGLQSQDTPNKKGYLIWNPVFEREKRNYPIMICHMKKTNFSCKHPDHFDNLGGRGKVPNIRYTENTTSRESFINPNRFPTLVTNDHRFTCSNATHKKGVTGVVPNLLVPEYLPVIER